LPLFRCLLGQQLRNHIPADIGQPKIPALEAEGQFRVVQSQEMQEGRVDVVDLGRAVAVERLVAEFVARAVGGSCLDPAAGQPVGEDEARLYRSDVGPDTDRNAARLIV
jgi:hypothetical protein